MENNKAVLDLDQLESVSGGTDMPTYGDAREFQFNQTVLYHDQYCIVKASRAILGCWYYDLEAFSGRIYDKVPEDQIRLG